MRFTLLGRLESNGREILLFAKAKRSKNFYIDSHFVWILFFGLPRFGVAL